MALTEYTSYQEVRAALGVSTTELTDVNLALPMHAIGLAIALDDINTGIVPMYDQLSALPSSGLTSLQKRFIEITSLFSTYSVAKSLLTSLPLFSVQRITDGRAEFQRNVDYYATLRDDIDATLLSLTYRLGLAYAALAGGSVEVPTRASLTSVLLSTLNTDPVTNAT